MKATLEQTLVYFDGPQVVLLKGGKTNIIAVAIERDGMEYPFFACRVLKRNWKRYLDGKADLHYLFLKTNLDGYFFFDWSKTENKRVDLVKATSVEISNKEYWPDKGFFAASHTEYLGEQEVEESTAQVFNIDGSWDPIDFSRFYGKISDLYALYFANKKLEDSNTSPESLRRLKGSVLTRLWKGGGSYTGFYRNFSDTFPDMTRLKVNRIEYASPGQIEMLGEESVFNDMLNSLTKFSFEDARNAQDAYNYIDNILSKEKLKTAKPDATFPSEAIEDEVKKKANLILKILKVKDTYHFFKACDENTLVYAKLALSIYRRFKGVSSFFIEGRVEVENF